MLEVALVVDELDGFGEVDGRTRLVSRFVEGGQLATGEAEETAAPVLFLS